MKLNEILNKKVDYEVINAKSVFFQTRATIGDRIINFGAVDNDDGSWDIQFAEKTKEGRTTYKKTGSGNELEVFSFVKDSLLDFISRYQPEKMCFTADKDSEEKDNRANTYERLLKRFIGTIPNYSFSSIADQKDNKSTLFFIVKNT